MAKKKAAGEKPSGRKARTKKPTAAETVQVSEGVQLLLGNMLGEKDRGYYVDTYLKLKAKKDKAQNDLTEFGKKAKEAGVDMKAMKDVLNMEKMDPLDLADLLKQMAAFARDRGLPVQFQLFEPKFESVEAQAKKFGYDAGFAGRNPLMEMYPEGTPGHEPMMQGWRSGQAQLVEDGKQTQH